MTPYEAIIAAIDELSDTHQEWSTAYLAVMLRAHQLMGGPDVEKQE